MRKSIVDRPSKRIAIKGGVLCVAGVAMLLLYPLINLVPILMVTVPFLLAGLFFLIIAYLYSVRVTDERVVVKLGILHWDIPFSKVVKVNKRIHYSCNSISTEMLIIYYSNRRYNFISSACDISIIEKALMHNNIIINAIKQPVQVGSNSQVHGRDCEVLSYRLMLAKRVLTPFCYASITLSLLGLVIDSRISSCILFVMTTIWYILLYEFRVLYAADCLPPYHMGNIWTKLGIPKDYKFIILIIVSLIILLIAMILNEKKWISLQYNHEAVKFVRILLLAVLTGLIYSFAGSEGSYIMVITLIVSLIVSIPYFNCASIIFADYKNATGSVVGMENDHISIVSFDYEDKEYFLHIQNDGIENDSKIDIVIHDNPIGGVYAYIPESTQ